MIWMKGADRDILLPEEAQFPDKALLEGSVIGYVQDYFSIVPAVIY